MGQNSQKRRADKRRRDQRRQAAGPRQATDPAPGVRAIDERAVVEAAMLISGNDITADQAHSLVLAMATVHDRLPVGERPIDFVSVLLHRYVAMLYESGWQPADVAHTVKRNTSARGQRLIVAIIASEARRSEAAQRAPLAWLSQLDDLGAYDPERAVIVGGHDQALLTWIRTEKLHGDEAIEIALRVLGSVLTCPRQPLIAPPPSRWTASNRGSLPKAASVAGPVDGKALKVIRALLAKAEGTTFDAEAEAFTAKAQEMMTRYSIDAAVLAAGAGDAGRTAGVESRRVHIDSPYADEKATFLGIIATVNRARSVWSPQVGFSTVTGFPVDLQLTDVLFTSLLVQATHSSAEATTNDRRLRTPSFRRAFLVAFADRIGERLESTQHDVATAAEAEYGASLLPILADRALAVADEVDRLFPGATTRRAKSYNSMGWRAGRAAADRAQLGHGEAIAAG